MFALFVPLITQIVLKGLDLLISDIGRRQEMKLSFLKIVREDSQSALNSAYIRKKYEELSKPTEVKTEKVI